MGKKFLANPEIAWSPHYEVCSELGGPGGPAPGLWSLRRPGGPAQSSVTFRNWLDSVDLPRVCSHCSELGGPGGPAQDLQSLGGPGGPAHSRQSLF